MKMKRFIAAGMRDAMQQVGEELGPDALILSSRKTEDGAEIIAAVDYEEELLDAGDSSTATPVEALSQSVQESVPAVAETAASAVKEEMPAPSVDDESLQEVRTEIRALRSMLEVPLSQLGWDEVRRREPVRAAIVEHLDVMQVHPVIANRIADGVSAINDDREGWKQATSILEGMLPVIDDDLLASGGTVALVGPTGVGKTTTIAKIAAAFAMRHGRRHVALVSMDHYRIGAHEQLRTYGRLLGVPVHIAGDAQELHAVLNQMHDRKLVLIDTAGTSQRDTELPDKFAALDTGDADIRRYLVLSATGQAELTDDIVRSFACIGPDKCILTKLDEATGIGGVLSVLIKHRLPLAWTGNGQRVPDDFHPARAHELVMLAEALAGEDAAMHANASWLHAMNSAGGDAHVHAFL
ncbi:MAG: flagellar biosynthesis protein FlhF [Gammaproteobacteria bacterium]|nr:flagellar biosynthesis protein FlhF [Gammaproteobacteria bacterium]